MSDPNPVDPVDAPPLETCEECNTEVPLIWRAADALWSTVAGDRRVLCPNCFDERAARLDLMLTWTPTLHERKHCGACHRNGCRIHAQPCCVFLMPEFWK